MCFCQHIPLWTNSGQCFWAQPATVFVRTIIESYKYWGAIHQEHFSSSMMVNTDKGLIRKWSAGSMYYYKTLLFHRCAILGFKIGAAIAEVQARLDDPVTRQMAAQHSLHPCTTSHFALVELHKRYKSRNLAGLRKYWAETRLFCALC